MSWWLIIFNPSANQTKSNKLCFAILRLVIFVGENINLSTGITIHATPQPYHGISSTGPAGMATWTIRINDLAPRSQAPCWILDWNGLHSDVSHEKRMGVDATHIFAKDIRIVSLTIIRTHSTTKHVIGWYGMCKRATKPLFSFLLLRKCLLSAWNKSLNHPTERWKWRKLSTSRDEHFMGCCMIFKPFRLPMFKPFKRS